MLVYHHETKPLCYFPFSHLRSFPDFVDLFVSIAYRSLRAALRASGCKNETNPLADVESTYINVLRKQISAGSFITVVTWDLDVPCTMCSRGRWPAAQIQGLGHDDHCHRDLLRFPNKNCPKHLAGLHVRKQPEIQ